LELGILKADFSILSPQHCIRLAPASLSWLASVFLILLYSWLGLTLLPWTGLQSFTIDKMQH